MITLKTFRIESEEREKIKAFWGNRQTRDTQNIVPEREFQFDSEKCQKIVINDRIALIEL